MADGARANMAQCEDEIERDSVRAIERDSVAARQCEDVMVCDKQRVDGSFSMIQTRCT